MPSGGDLTPILDREQRVELCQSALLLDEYQNFTARSDRSGQPGLAGLEFVLLGLLGEVGSLLSALKKKQRDKEAYVAYHDEVLEEFGDVLWYLSNAALRLGRTLSQVAAAATHATGIPSIRDAQEAASTLAPQRAFGMSLIELGAKTGSLLEAFQEFPSAHQHVRAKLPEVFFALVRAADVAGISLEVAARRNIAKSESRWPAQRHWVPALDASFPLEERLPRRMVAVFSELRKEDGRPFVTLELNGVKFGNDLTDNRPIQDDYRFHDIFHLAHATFLGWSPTLRALLRRKRKSVSQVDENEDGARAILIEEGISTWIFNKAERTLFFRHTAALDYGILKSVREFVRGYEAEVLPMWQWEAAILEGFRVFRMLQETRGGTVIADLDEHTLEFRA
jgi:NTP pyrophosphatase (non-canonical NTP hydrolase)